MDRASMRGEPCSPRMLPLSLVRLIGTMAVPLSQFMLGSIV
jgi:hypothetical protein